MAGKKTTTVTNIVRCNATDSKKFIKHMGEPVKESDKLHFLKYDVYGIDDDGYIYNIGEGYNRFALIPRMVTVKQAVSNFTDADRREMELLKRLIDAGIASDDEVNRFNFLGMKEVGESVTAKYYSDDVSGKYISEESEIGKYLSTMFLA